MTKTSLTLRIVYALCLAGATIVHITIHAQYGVLLGGLEAAGFSLPTRVFWSSLTLLDPIAVVLLFTRPRLGLVLTSAVILSDIAHNSWLVYRAGGTSDPKYWRRLLSSYLFSGPSKSLGAALGLEGLLPTAVSRLGYPAVTSADGIHRQCRFSWIEHVWLGRPRTWRLKPNSFYITHVHYGAPLQSHPEVVLLCQPAIAA